MVRDLDSNGAIISMNTNSVVALQLSGGSSEVITTVMRRDDQRLCFARCKGRSLRRS